MGADTKLELTWIGKYDEQPDVEPRIFIENPKFSYGTSNESAEILSNGKHWNGNMIIHGDNLLALRALEKDFSGMIKCIYIDPPYNTGEAFDEYDDNLEHSIWLDLMYRRLVILKNLLSEDGVIFVQLNDDEMNYCKIIMDEIFGRNNFVNLISVKTKNSSGASGGGEDKKLKKNIEYILCYAKPDFKKFYPSYTTMELSKYLEEMKANGTSFKYTTVFTDFGEKKYFKTIKDGGGKDIIIYSHSHYSTKSITQLASEDGISEIEAFNKYFEYICTTENAQTSIRTRVQEATDKENNLYSIEYYPVSGKNKDRLTTVYFVGTTKRLVSWFKNVCIKERGYIFKKEKIGSLWSDLNWNNVNREGGVVFSGGKKPEVLLQRIFELATLPGDIVLDSFLGSGTSAAVAHKMGRKYIGVELGPHAYSLCYPRLKAVVNGQDQTGISNDQNWKGGGGFKFYELAPSLLKKDAHGHLVINKEYNADMLAAAMAKMEGFTYEPSNDVFWKQGYSSETDFIYTTTQFVTAESLGAILDTMADGESLLVCCKAFQPECKNFSSRISIKKIPSVLLGRCEFDHDDYSLNIIELPQMDEEDEPEVDFLESDEPKTTLF